MSLEAGELLDQQTKLDAELLHVQSDDQIEDAALNLSVAKLLGVGRDEILVDFHTETVPVVLDKTGQHRTSQLDVSGLIDGINGPRRSIFCFDHTVKTPEFMSEDHRIRLGGMAVTLTSIERFVLAAPLNRKFLSESI